MFQSFISYSLGYPKFLEEQFFSWKPPRIWLLTSRQLPNYSKAFIFPGLRRADSISVFILNKAVPILEGLGQGRPAQLVREPCLLGWPLAAPFQRGTQKTFWGLYHPLKAGHRNTSNGDMNFCQCKGKTRWPDGVAVTVFHSTVERCAVCTVHRPSCYQNNRRKRKKLSPSVIHLSPQSQEAWLPKFLNGWSVSFSDPLSWFCTGKGVLLRKNAQQYKKIWQEWGLFTWSFIHLLWLF